VEGEKKGKVSGRERKGIREGEEEGKWKGEGKEKGEGKKEGEGGRKIAFKKVGRTHGRTHGHSGDFILCPMLCIALDSNLKLVLIIRGMELDLGQVGVLHSAAVGGRPHNVLSVG